MKSPTFTHPSSIREVTPRHKFLQPLNICFSSPFRYLFCVYSGVRIPKPIQSNLMPLRSLNRCSLIICSGKTPTLYSRISSAPMDGLDSPSHN